MIELNPKWLEQPSAFLKLLKSSKKEAKKIQNIISDSYKLLGNIYEFNDFARIMLGFIRSKYMVQHQQSRYFSLEPEIFSIWTGWIINHTVSLSEPEISRLLLFSIAMAYKMKQGATGATTTAKIRRRVRREFLDILSDNFTGKAGEIVLEQFLKMYNKHIELDWDISIDLSKHVKDIRNCEFNVDIKSSPNLGGAWAEANQGSDYGVFVKICVSEAILLELLKEISGLEKLINYIREKLDTQDREKLNELIKYVEESTKKKIKLIGLILGWFKCEQNHFHRKGEELPYLGELESARYLLPCHMLIVDKNPREYWEGFCQKISLK